MHHPDSHHRLRNLAGVVLVAAAVGAGLFVTAGCQQKADAPKPPPQRYTELRDKDLPPFLQGTVGQLAERTNDEPYASATYGLVGRLRGTGDSTASLQVREWMLKQMIRHGYGSKLIPGYDKLGPERVLREPSYAIVRVDGMIPPGAREGDQFDVQVTALQGNKTTSLTGGMLFDADLAQIRGNSPDLAAIDTLARAHGWIVINPFYALEDGSTANVQAKASLRNGTIMDGGMVLNDRAIILRLRHPNRANARYIEQRINQRFQHVADRRKTNSMPAINIVAQALDEGIVEVFIPKSYKGDWQHFMGVVEQLYLSASPAVLVAKAKELTEEAVKPGSPLLEISYALEGIGEPALQYTLPLLAHPSPDVSFAMARASAFIPDPSGAAQQTLFRIARDDNNPFQLEAIRTLGLLPNSPERNQRLHDLLESPNRLPRTEAYKILAERGQLYSKVIGGGTSMEKFMIDVVPSGGEPLVYASRSGTPRIAIIGPTPKLQLPIVFTTMNGRLMISSDLGNGGAGGRSVTIFFRRDDEKKEPLRMQSRPDIGEIVARLGGEGAPDEDRFSFSYGEIVAVLQSLSQQKKITAALPGSGQARVAPFIFEQPRESQDLIQTAPVIPQDSRPNTGGAARAADDEIKDINNAGAQAPARSPRTGATVAQK
jgi:hypothetical protein